MRDRGDNRNNYRPEPEQGYGYPPIQVRAAEPCRHHLVLQLTAPPCKQEDYVAAAAAAGPHGGRDRRNRQEEWPSAAKFLSDPALEAHSASALRHAGIGISNVNANVSVSSVSSVIGTGSVAASAAGTGAVLAAAQVPLPSRQGAGGQRSSMCCQRAWPPVHHRPRRCSLEPSPTWQQRLRLQRLRCPWPR